tara:strand:+ start:1193 stop:1375 length:183 start_codon:yes stop_codon:yes gene_type:complete
MTPYTAIEERAKKRRIPTGGSATWRRVLWPNIETVPSPPFVKSPPIGTIAKDRKAGTKER